MYKHHSYLAISIISKIIKNQVQPSYKASEFCLQLRPSDLTQSLYFILFITKLYFPDFLINRTYETIRNGGSTTATGRKPGVKKK